MKIWALIFLLLVGAAWADPSNAERLSPFQKHLEFLGYTVDNNGERLLCKHPTHYNFVLAPQNSGYCLFTVFDQTDYGKGHRPEVLEFANHLNNNAIAARYVARDGGSFVIEGYFPDDYDKTRFGNYLENWNGEVAGTVSKNNADFDKFLK